MRAIAILLAACGVQSAPEVPHNTAAPAAAASSCPRDGNARLTIVTGALPAGCSGGVFTIDGEHRGQYPVSCAPVPAGRHVVGVTSANDCAGYMRCKLEFFVDQETTLDLRSPSCGTW